MSVMRRHKKRAVLLTPLMGTETTVDLSADASGLAFRKKILPLGSISYPDPDAPSGTRKVSFDAGYHDELIRNFKAGAVECPTVQLADERNGHNMDLTRTAGEVTDLSRERPGDQDGPGLYATIRARNEDHARLLHEMPRLGVSAQIKERFGRVDGAKFKAALRHILVTADPRVVGLGPWRAVSLSTGDDDGPVIDLSGGDYEEMEMGAGQHSIPTNDGVLSLSDDDIEAALEEAAQAAAEELDNEGEQGGDGVQLSADASGTLRSFASGLEERDVTIRGMQAKLAGSDWERERLSLSNAGVPKPLLDEAEKVLKFPGESVVSLSDEDGREFTHDSRSTIRRMLELSKGIIDLSDVPGTSADTLDLSADGEVTDDKLAELAEKQGGIS